jgi:hypothetical protein
LFGGEPEVHGDSSLLASRRSGAGDDPGRAL